MWPRGGTVLTVSSRAMVGACERLGVDTEAMLRSVGVSRATLDDPDGRLEASQVSALWSKAYELSGDPVLSLHAAEACPIGAYKIIDFMGANSATVGESFRCAARYFPIINTAVRLVIDESGDPVTFDVEAGNGPADVPRPYAEYCFAAFVLHCRGTTGVYFALRHISFVHPKPADIREHERIFGCPVQFEAKHNRIEFDRTQWELPASGSQPGVLQILTQHADQLVQKLPRGPDLVERTRRAIGARLRGGDPSLEEVARELAVSGRSLQRHLRELGYSYQALSDEVRAQTAQLYLEQPDIAIAEVAYLLGFSEPSAFNRAYKRWTGNSPARARTMLRAAGARPTGA